MISTDRFKDLDCSCKLYADDVNVHRL